MSAALHRELRGASREVPRETQGTAPRKFQFMSWGFGLYGVTLSPKSWPKFQANQDSKFVQSLPGFQDSSLGIASTPSSGLRGLNGLWEVEGLGFRV